MTYGVLSTVFTHMIRDMINTTKYEVLIRKKKIENAQSRESLVVEHAQRAIAISAAPRWMRRPSMYQEGVWEAGLRPRHLQMMCLGRCGNQHHKPTLLGTSTWHLAPRSRSAWHFHCGAKEPA